MPTLSEAKEANAATKLPFSPVAVFVGGTSGVGQGSVEAFARHTGDNAHLIIVGRNEEAAKQIIGSLPKGTNSRYEFLRCDASKLANVVEAAKTLKEQHGLTKLNYLFMSQGYMTTRGSFDDNGEGIDRKLAVHYYSRFKFFTELAPLLQTAKDAGEEARVVSVLAAGKGYKADTTDLGLKNTYSLTKCGIQSPTYNSLTIEEFAKRYPSFSFSHLYPGAVNTNILGNSWPVSILRTIASPLMTSVQDCGEWMVRALYDPAFAKGAHHLDNHANPVPKGRLYLNEADQKDVFNHFMEISSKF